jgi:deazaflavin-dependent oxidoreductase (nitroreductase family)
MAADCPGHGRFTLAAMSDDHLFGQDHVRQYQDSDGEQGYHWRKGSKILLLTTTGRKSGEPRTLPLIFGEDDGRYVLVASKGGAPEHPAWYQNLTADPEVELQVKADVFKARAHDAEGEERERLWEMMLGEWPDYAAYQERTDRQIPVVILERS